MITITIDGQQYSHDASPAEVAGLGAARVKYNTAVADKEGEPTFEDGADFLQWCVEDRLAQFPDEAPTDIMARALASFAGQPIPEPVITGLSPEEAKARLITHAETTQLRIKQAGTVINGVPVSTSKDGRLDLVGAVALAQLHPDHVFDWDTDSGVIQLTGTQVIAIGVAVGLWVQSTYTALAAVRAAINDGTITTTEEIDAANWPS